MEYIFPPLTELRGTALVLASLKNLPRSSIVGDYTAMKITKQFRHSAQNVNWILIPIINLMS